MGNSPDGENMLTSPKKAWGFVPILLAVATASVLLLIISANFVSANTSTVKRDFWGFDLSAAGYVLSAVGFTFTLWQLAKAQNETAAVNNAIRRLRRDFGSLDVISELRAARSASIEARSFFSQFKKSDKPPTLARYDTIRECLNKAIAVDSPMSNEDIEIIKNFIADAYGACTILDEWTGPVSSLDRASLQNKLRELEDALVQIEQKIKGSFGV